MTISPTSSATGSSAVSAPAPQPASTSAASGATSKPAPSPSPSPSAVVTLSDGAKAMAYLATQGITVTRSSIEGLQRPASNSSDDLNQFEKQLRAASVAPPSDGTSKQGSVNLNDFKKVVAKLGGNESSAEKLFGALDKNGNNLVENSELLKALSNLYNNSNDAASTSLLSLMDGNHDQSVSEDEFLNLETTFVAAEKLRS